MVLAAPLLLSALAPAAGWADSGLPGPRELPSAPAEISGLQDFESRLAAVQNAFFAYRASGARTPVAGSVLYLETEPVTAPLLGGREPIACEDFLRVAADATRKWERVVERIEVIRKEIREIRRSANAKSSEQGLGRIRAQIEAAGRDVDAVRQAYPTDVFGVPDRVIRYEWRLAPRSLIDEWGEGWIFLDDSFAPDFLAMPGYTWAGQGRLSELSTIASEPQSTGRSIVLERVASPATACAGKDAVWMSGNATIRFKRAPTKPQGCSGESCLGQGPAGIIEVREGVQVVLRGEKRRPGLDVNLPGTSRPPCPKQDGHEDKPPTECPD